MLMEYLEAKRSPVYHALAILLSPDYRAWARQQRGAGAYKARIMMANIHRTRSYTIIGK